MMPEILDVTPPNFLAIIEKFPRALRGQTIYAYAPNIYNPTAMVIPKALLAHEAVHIVRQGDDAGGWWEKYIADPEFRLREEIDAHEAEARSILDDIGWNRKSRKQVSAICGERLAAPLYEYPNLTKKAATKLIYHLLSTSEDDCCGGDCSDVSSMGTEEAQSRQST